MGWLDERRQERRERVEQDRDDRAGGRGEPGSRHPEDYVLLARQAVLLGGLPGVKAPAYGRLEINIEGLTFGNNIVGTFTPEWSEFSHVTVETRTESRSRLAGTVLFGVMALGEKDSDRFSDVLFHRMDATMLAFGIRDVPPSALRAALAPTLSSVNLSFDAPRRPSAASLVDELERLAALHTSGALTDEEFSEFKNQLRQR
jgi:hypothetical protein